MSQSTRSTCPGPKPCACMCAREHALHACASPQSLVVSGSTKGVLCTTVGTGQCTYWSEGELGFRFLAKKAKCCFIYLSVCNNKSVHCHVVRIATGHERRASRRADTIDVVLLQTNTRHGQSVDVGSGELGSVIADVVPAQVIDDEHDDVRRTGLHEREACQPREEKDWRFCHGRRWTDDRKLSKDE